jgi:SOS-response transcriptional repressor LexA
MNVKQVAQRLTKFGQTRFGDKHGWQKEFADALAMSPQALSNYLSGRVAPGNAVQAKLRALGADVEYIMTGKTREQRGEEALSIGIPMDHRIQFLGKVVATPGGKEYFENYEDKGIFVPSAVPGQYFALEVEGISLIDADPPIYPGDIVIFERGRQPKTGEIVAVALTDGQKMVKILKHRSVDEVELHSANKHVNFPFVTLKKSEIAFWGIYAGMQRWTKEQKKRLGIE